MLLRMTSALLRAIAITWLLCAAPLAWGQAAAPAPFEQGRMPLAEALDRFGRHFDFDIVAPDAIVRGKTAARVAPTPTPLQALRQMLAGTGLHIRFTRPDAIVLEAEAAASADMTLDRLTVRATAETSAATRYTLYGQYLLESCLGLLRASADLADREYELRVYLWVDPEGRISRMRVRADPGQDREIAIAETVLAMLLPQAPPPSEMPQPVKLRIASR